MGETMAEDLAQLEEKVGALISALSDARGDLRPLREHNSKQEEEIVRLQEENERLAARIQELEDDIEGISGKESAIRDRLQGILEKIDAVEQEIHAAEKVGASDGGE